MLYIRFRPSFNDFAEILWETIGNTTFYDDLRGLMAIKDKHFTVTDSPPPFAAGGLEEGLRKHDKDRFLCALFAPSERRPALVALYAFNAEIAGIRDSVSETLIAQMRLKWWYDALDGIARGQIPKHPVAEALAVVLAKCPPIKDPLIQLIETRAADLVPVQPSHMGALERYGDETSGQLARVALQVLGAPEDDRIDEVARHVGIAWSMVGLLRVLPFHAARGYLYLPLDMCGVAGIDPEVALSTRYGQKTHDGVIAVVKSVADVARDNLLQARNFRHKMPAVATPVCLQAVLADSYLRRLASVAYDPAALRMARLGPGPGTLMRLAWNALRRTY